MEKYLTGKLSEASIAKAKSIQERRIAYGAGDR
jgi:penicillin-binding protein 2